MLFLSYVPKGTPIISYSVQGFTFTDHTQFWGGVCSFVPYQRTFGTRELDLGYISQGETHGREKDVTHFSAEGRGFLDTFTTRVKTPNSFDQAFTYPSVFGDVWTIPALKTNGQATSFFSHAFCAAGGSCGASAHGIRVSGSQSPRDYRHNICMGWPTSTLCVAFYTQRTNLSGSQTTYNFSSINYWKFSDDYSKVIFGTVAVPGNPYPIGVNAGWEEYYAAIAPVVIPVTVGLVPNSPILSNLPVTSLVTSDDLLATLKPSLDWEGRLDRANPVWGDLAADCYSQISLWDSNGLAYMKDLIGLGEFVKSTVSAVHSLISLNPKTLLKDLADVFLSFRYGWCLTAKDTVSLVTSDYDALYPQGRCKRSSAYTYLTNEGMLATARMAVYCRPYSNSISELGSFLELMDLDLTAENLWDLVPYSFVVDWFFNLGGIFERMDQWNKIDNFDIFLTGRSLKGTEVVDLNEIWGLHSVVGTCKLHYYKRTYTTDVFKPSLISFRSGQKFDHWLESSALVVQRL